MERDAEVIQLADWLSRNSGRSDHRNVTERIGLAEAHIQALVRINKRQAEEIYAIRSQLRDFARIVNTLQVRIDEVARG